MTSKKHSIGIFSNFESWRKKDDKDEKIFPEKEHQDIVNNRCVIRRTVSARKFRNREIEVDRGHESRPRTDSREKERERDLLRSNRNRTLGFPTRKFVLEVRRSSNLANLIGTPLDPGPQGRRGMNGYHANVQFTSVGRCCATVESARCV